jgi:oxaloacetate decarboxylase alpha subunit
VTVLRSGVRIADMAQIEFVDQTIRDGPQSLWGFKMTSAQMEAATSHLDNTGFAAIEVQTSFAERLMRENRWERLDVLRARMPKSHLRTAKLASGTGKMGFTPDSVFDLMVQTNVKHGVNSFWVLDCLYNLDKMQRVCRVISETGVQVLPTIIFGDAPSQTDEYYASIVRTYTTWGVDGIFIEDAPGILRPERARTLLPALVAAAAGLPVELHCHNTTGMAPLNYLAGIDAGIRTLHTASSSMANGPSLPSTEMTVQNLEWLGHTHGLDTSQFPAVAKHFDKVARQEGHMLGIPAEHDVSIYQHQTPGGMMGSLRASLREHNVLDRLGEVLREIPRVRAELGHPVSATPFSQFMGIQAVLNVVTGDRYSLVPDEVISYALGHFGTPPEPIDPNVKDRILANPNAARLRDWVPEQPTLAEVRQQYGLRLSDEELLNAYMVDPADIAATEAEGPILGRTYSIVEEAGAEALLAEIMPRTRIGHARVRADGLDLTLTRSCAAHG